MQVTHQRRPFGSITHRLEALNRGSFPLLFEVEHYLWGVTRLSTTDVLSDERPLRGLRVVVADAFVLATDGVKCCLERAGAQVISHPTGSANLAETVLATRPDLAILDSQPESVSAISTIRALWPAAALFLIGGFDAAAPSVTIAEAGMAAGAAALLSYSQPFSTLVETVLRFVPRHADETLEEADSEKADDNPEVVEDTLSDRQLDILRGVVSGLNVRQIGKEHGISYKTVNNHLTAIYRRLGAQNLTQAIVIATRKGLISIQ
jgi:DNA-binding NarL/FixJ family response regulator